MPNSDTAASHPYAHNTAKNAGLVPALPAVLATPRGALKMEATTSPRLAGVVRRKINRPVRPPNSTMKTLASPRIHKTSVLTSRAPNALAKTDPRSISLVQVVRIARRRVLYEWVMNGGDGCNPRQKRALIGQIVLLGAAAMILPHWAARQHNLPRRLPREFNGRCRPIALEDSQTAPSGVSSQTNKALSRRPFVSRSRMDLAY